MSTTVGTRRNPSVNASPRRVCPSGSFIAFAAAAHAASSEAREAK